MITERTYFGDTGDAVLICEESDRDGAVVYMFQGYPKDGENVMATSITDVNEYIDELTRQNYVIPEIWEAGGSRFIRVPRSVGVAARDVATRALYNLLYQARSNRYERLEERRHAVEFFTEDARRVTFVERGPYLHHRSFALSEDELEAASDATGLEFDAVQAYATAFETTDVDDFEGEHFAGALDGGNTLEEWYLDHVEDYEVMVGKESHTVGDLIAALNEFGLTVEATDTVRIDQEFTEQGGFIFRNH